jgi:hypothetical protein
VLGEADPAEMVEHDGADQLTGYDESCQRRRAELSCQQYRGDGVDRAERATKPAPPRRSSQAGQRGPRRPRADA